MGETLLVDWQTYFNTIGIGLLTFLLVVMAIAMIPIRGLPEETPTLIGLLVAGGYLLTTVLLRE